MNRYEVAIGLAATAIVAAWIMCDRENTPPRARDLPSPWESVPGCVVVGVDATHLEPEFHGIGVYTVEVWRSDLAADALAKELVFDIAINSATAWNSHQFGVTKYSGVLYEQRRLATLKAQAE